MARYLVEAHVLEGRSVSELAAAHGVHRSWIYKLLARYREGGIEALQPRSRRPRSCKHETPEVLVQAIVALRNELVADGHDAGAATIAYHLAKRIETVPSRATIWRILKREGLIVPQPQKRPRCSLIRFAQLDTFVHYYNDIRPHRALDGRTPLQAYSTRIKAKPTGPDAKTHFRVRQDKVDKTGKVSLRYHSKLYKIGLGRAHTGRTIKLPIADQHIRVIDLQRQLIRELTLDPTRNYQPLTPT
ncbi:MAG TPA: helix-turn-helix domain-containing protein [Solirubrobacteraceae bacterium]